MNRRASGKIPQGGQTSTVFDSVRHLVARSLHGWRRISIVAQLDQLIGESPGIAALRDQVSRLLARPLDGARRLPPILLLGETGTGKGLVAQAIHRAGPRADGPFVDLNCAAIPDSLLEAELFGYERGAFTDARQGKPGLLQVAHGGSLFLDEVGLLPDALQAKILKAIEERAVRRLGSTRREVVDVWVIAATSEDLLEAVKARRFREDLYHRLAVITLQLPPLRARADDVLLLAEHFLAEACVDYGLPPRPLTADARAALMNHRWPGNVRELANLMERVALLTDVPAITAEVLGLARPPVVGGPVDAWAERHAIARAEAELERAHLVEALRTERWNLSRAADRLGLPRNTLRYRMEKHGLLAPKSVRLRVEAPALMAPAADAVAVAAATAEGAPQRVAFLQVRLDISTASPESRRLMESLMHKLQGFGGTLDDLTPSSVLAVFGVEPLEDAPRWAALAALAVRQLVARRQEIGKPSAAMQGLHTALQRSGLTTAPSDREPDTATPARAVAAALCAEAAPGEILASGPAAQLLAPRFELSAVDETARRASRRYRLVGPLPADLEIIRFLGRHAELELLLDRFERAAAGHGQAVQLVGDPGIGKSRLLRELRRRVAGRAIWIEGQADPARRARAFGPVIDLVRRAAGIDDADPEPVAQAALERHVVGVSAEIHVDLPWLRDMLGLASGDASTATMEPASRRAQIFEANRRLLLYAAARRPQIVVVEDVHWADRASLEFLARLAESVAGHRALLMVTSRPGGDFRLSERTHHTRLALEALTRDESLDMARGLLGADTLAPEIEALVIERAEGNPFFVEELVRSMLDLGAVRRESSRAVVAAAAALRTVPATVQDMIQARIARLDVASRGLLEVAAVVGTEAPLAVLRAAASETSPRELLERLEAAELVTERALPEPALAFKHALTREVAYAGLVPERRRTLHARVVRAMEHAYGERAGEQIEQLAHHAFQGALWDRAVGYLRQAGVRATARSNNDQAVTFLEQALHAIEQTREGPERTAQAIDARFELRNALLPLGEVRLALQHLREAERLAEASGDVRRLGWASTSMTNCLVMVGDLGEAHRAGERAARLADAFADTPLTIVSRTDLGVVNQERGETQRAIVLFREALGRLRPEHGLERFGMSTPAAIYLRSLLAANLAERGDFAEAIAAGDEAVRMAEGAGLAFGLAAAWVRLGEVYLILGDTKRAGAVIETALTLMADRHLPLWFPRATAALGWSRVLAGRTAEGATLLDQARERAAALPYLFRYSRYLVWSGYAALSAGELELAERFAEEAFARSSHRGEQGYELEARRLAAEVAGQSDGAAAEKAARELINTADRAATLGLRPLVAHCNLSAGELCAHQGDRARAREHLAAAGALYQALGMSLYAARAERAAADA
jgi:DNA-binding NtrC family response regulator/tetratricopeptide (TPR) repeat protein